MVVLSLFIWPLNKNKLRIISINIVRLTYVSIQITYVSNYYLLEVVGHGSEAQLQVGKNLIYYLI